MKLAAGDVDAALLIHEGRLLRTPGMNLGPAEIMVVLLVALLVMGPHRLPEAGRTVAKGLAQFRNLQSTIKDEISGLTEDVMREPAQENAEPVVSTEGGTFS